MLAQLLRAAAAGSTASRRYSGALWKFVFLFYNPKLHRLLLFSCGAWSSASPHVKEDDTLSDDDEEMY